MEPRHGGDRIGAQLARNGVARLFTLCGGHISPLLVGAKAHGIRVVDVRDEKNAVFAADATARMTGTVGVAVVTAGPGVTNTITAVKNAAMAQSPVLVIGGATATLLKGRGALQDIDQLSLMRPAVKWACKIKTVSALVPTVQRAIDVARSGVPGPVFVEIPVDLLYPEAIVREWYFKQSGVESSRGLGGKILGAYLRRHLRRQFGGLDRRTPPEPGDVGTRIEAGKITSAAGLLRGARRPALVVGSQALVGIADAAALAAAIERLGVPTWLGGMARGLLGGDNPLQFRHRRGKALKEADVVVVAGFPFDFRLGYGRSISPRAKVIAANLSRNELRKNRRPTIPARMHAGEFLIELAQRTGDRLNGLDDWIKTLRERESERDEEIRSGAASGGPLVDPLHLFERIDRRLTDSSVLVVDGGDFVATGSYVLRPRSPLSWLDPGAFGTLGVGGGFALAAAMARPGADVWLIYGDGSSAYSLAEFDTYARHGVAPIAVVGTDASWTQIARDQVKLLGDDVGTGLVRTAYHEVAEGYGGTGLLLDDPARVDETLDRALAEAHAGRPVCINVHLAATDFREGSLSI